MILTVDQQGTGPLEAELKRLRHELVRRLVRHDDAPRIREVERQIQAMWTAMERDVDGPLN